CRSQDIEIFLNSVSLAAASACAPNLATQTGVSALTTAMLARSLAMRSAELLSVHPSAENPTIAMATAPTTAPQTAGLISGCDLIVLTVLSGGRRHFVCKRTLRQPEPIGSETTH